MTRTEATRHWIAGVQAVASGLSVVMIVAAGVIYFGVYK